MRGISLSLSTPSSNHPVGFVVLSHPLCRDPGVIVSTLCLGHDPLGLYVRYIISIETVYTLPNLAIMPKSIASDLPLSKQLNDLKTLYASDSRARALVLWTASATSMIGLVGFFAGSRFIQASRRIPNADWMHPGLLLKRPLIRGVVTRVGDADNFRLYHTPGPFWFWPFKFRKVPTNSKDLANETLHIRINAVDAPEGAHFGREAQPKSQEALQWLKDQIGGKTIWCRPLRRDHHGRIVASCYLPPRLLPNNVFKGKHLSMEMLRAGWATVYEQGGAEYDPYTKEAFLRVETEAKAAKRGIWEKGSRLKETPAEYKRRHVAAEAAAAAAGVASK
ncbi:unnamed protein product [Rhizoctonia solani]|uniref:TNase-like domain-containing protein n=2 Tax=Rhizoctonia solani TaxID=456999 RepID=A0A8H3BD08_9AGAM|nr:unnamed protein product [Rhizoctonia solani]